MKRFQHIDPIVHVHALESVLDEDGRTVLQFLVRRLFLVVYAKVFGLGGEITHADLEKSLLGCLKSLSPDGPESARLAEVLTEMFRTFEELVFRETSEEEDGALLSKLVH